MSIERISTIFNSGAGERFKILYGPGIEDVFFNRKLLELKFEEALFEELRRQGFDRIVFFSPHRSIFFFDSQSEELSRPKAAGPGLQEPTGFNQTVQLSAGPLHDLKIFQPIPSSQEAGTRRGIGDVFALRMLDKIMRDDEPIRSAVVILQSETALRFFDDQRTLAGLIGDWTRLPSFNRNLCFFVFSADDYAGLSQIAVILPVPELRTMITGREVSPETASNIIKIGSADVKEIRYMLYRHQQKYPLEVQEEDVETLCKRMAAEGRQNRTWLARLQAVQKLDLETSRQQGWFTANLQPESSVWERMDALVGLDPVKKRVKELADWLVILQKRQESRKRKVDFPSLQMIFTGNPGTGKTTIARMFAEVLYEIGMLKRGQLVEARASDLVADHVGGTAIKTNSLVDRALDGVLFIDEAYTLIEEGRGGFGQEAIETLLARLEDDRQHLVVIAAGYPERMVKFRQSNPGLERRFPLENILHFEDFSKDQLAQILFANLRQKELVVTPEMSKTLTDLARELWRQKNEHFGNAGEMRNLAEGLDRRHASRVVVQGLSDDEPLKADDIPPAYQHLLPGEIPNPSQFLTELEKLVGLSEVKEFLKNWFYRLEFENLRYHTQAGSAQRPKLLHMVFKGNPGTGKTTVARLVGKIYQALGLLRQGHCVEVSRVDLVAGYVGQTAQKTKEKIKAALDGVLFIDEAYSLANDTASGFGQEAIDMLVKAMEDYQGRFVVILAGYPDEINQLLAANPGLHSRFAQQLDFKDYSLAELVEILQKNMQQEGYIFSEAVLQKAQEYLRQSKQRYQRYFGNARTVQTLFEMIKTRLAQRVVPLTRSAVPEELAQMLNTIQPEDVPEPEVYSIS